MRNWFRRDPPVDINDLIKPPRVVFEGYEGDTAKLKPQGVKRTDAILRARAELGVGLPPPRFLDRFTRRRPRPMIKIEARDMVTLYRERKAAR